MGSTRLGWALRVEKQIGLGRVDFKTGPSLDSSKTRVTDPKLGPQGPNSGQVWSGWLLGSRIWVKFGLDWLVHLAVLARRARGQSKGFYTIRNLSLKQTFKA